MGKWKARIDPELAASISLYRASGKGHSSSKLYHWFQNTPECNPESFHELVRFLVGLTPVTVVSDREVLLCAMDFINKANLRKPEYLEDYLDALPLFDEVMLITLNASKKDTFKIRKFCEEQSKRLSLVTDLEACYRILNEADDMGNRMLDLLSVSASLVGAKLFEKTKADVYNGYIGSFINAQIETWDPAVVLTKEMVEQTRSTCKNEVAPSGPGTLFKPIFKII